MYAIFLPGLGFDGRQILFWCMMIKVCCIPFFRLVFLVAAGLFIMIIPLLPFLLIFDYRLLPAGSAYGVRGLLSCRKEGRLSDRTAAANIVLQFLFCADVFSAVYCYIKAAKAKIKTDFYIKNAAGTKYACLFVILK